MTSFECFAQYENIPDDTTVVLIVFPAAPEINRSLLKEVNVNSSERGKNCHKVMFLHFRKKSTRDSH